MATLNSYSNLNLNKEKSLFYKIPAVLYILVFAYFLTALGLSLDISWHGTIGRDRIFTLPHIFFIASPFASAIISLYTIFLYSSSAENLKNHSIQIGRLYAPSGIWLLLIGGIFFLISFTLDNWWHQTFGIDVTLHSTTHLLIQSVWFLSISVSLFFIYVINNLENQNKIAWILFIFFNSCGIWMITAKMLN